MIKNGRIEIGKTPSVVTGACSTRILEGEPVGDHEHPNDPEFRKLASLMVLPTPDDVKEIDG
jgi:hypothetical protein